MSMLATAVQNVLDHLNAASPGAAWGDDPRSPAADLADAARAAGIQTGADTQWAAERSDQDLPGLYDRAIAECTGDGPLYRTLCAQYAALTGTTPPDAWRAAAGRDGDGGPAGDGV